MSSFRFLSIVDLAKATAVVEKHCDCDAAEGSTPLRQFIVRRSSGANVPVRRQIERWNLQNSAKRSESAITLSRQAAGAC
jgi:hypothetical protein